MGVDRAGIVEVSLVSTPQELGLELPEFTPLPSDLPFGLYTRSGSILYLSGHIPDIAGSPPIRGRLGDELNLEEGRAAARSVALNLISTLGHATGDLNRVTRILKLTGFVSSSDDFTSQPEVINAASEVFVALWGKSGLHARSAVGVNQLPFGVPVEIELIAELDDSS